MPRILQQFFLVVVLVLFNGCSGTTGNNSSFGLSSKPQKQYALVYIYRLEAYPRMIAPEILVDKQSVLELPEKGYTKILLPEGIHQFSTRWPKQAGVDNLDYQFSVTPGRIYYIKLTGTFDVIDAKNYKMDTFATMLDPKIASKELKKRCKYISTKEFISPKPQPQVQKPYLLN